MIAGEDCEELEMSKGDFEQVIVKIESKKQKTEEISKATLISKDELRSSKCCRLCGIGSKIYENFLDSESTIFIPIFEQYEKSLQDEPLDRIINRYLPIEVFESDLVYPRVICSFCYNCLESTITFFNQITEGQHLLSKILNGNRSKESSTKLNPVFSFSEDNPVIKAPKKRGRPRKQTTKLNSLESSHPPEIPEISERRTKRQSRPPARYIDQILLDPFSNHTLDEEDETDKKVFTVAQLKDSIASKNAIQLEKSNEDRFDVAKSGNNDGEDGLELKMELSNIGSVHDDLTNMIEQSTTRDKIDSAVLICEGNKTIQRTHIGTTKHLNEKDMMNEESEKSDGDVSVKLSDLIRCRKKPVKRKRKYKVRKNVTKIQCNECPKSFNHSSSLVYHRLSVHDQTKRFNCNICERAFHHKQLLNNHMYVHSDEKYFECEICPSKAFKSRASLYTHMKSIHSQSSSFQCDQCGSQFNLKSSLKGHMRLHTGEKPFQCEFCQKKFAQRSNLREHRRTHTGEKPYHCIECNKSFTTASQLRSHKFCHSGQKAHLCQICGKGFSHTENFKYHMRRHSGERPLECPICQKQFAESWSLKKHYRLHTGEKPYQCKKCNKVFSDPSNFGKHKRIHLNQSDLEAEAVGSSNLSSSVDICSPNTNESKEDTSKIGNIDENNSTNKNSFKLEKIEIPDSTSTIISSNDISEPARFVSGDGASSIVQILRTDNISYENSRHDDEQVEQVIYVYSGDGPLFTFAMTDTQNSTEARIIENDDNDGVQSFGSGSFENVNPSEFESHYYSLETVGGNTIAVPISMTQSTTSAMTMDSENHIPNASRILTGHVAIDVDEISAYIPETESS